MVSHEDSFGEAKLKATPNLGSITSRCSGEKAAEIEPTPKYDVRSVEGTFSCTKGIFMRKSLAVFTISPLFW